MASVKSPIYFWAPHFEASLLMLISPFPRLFVYSFFFPFFDIFLLTLQILLLDKDNLN